MKKILHSVLILTFLVSPMLASAETRASITHDLYVGLKSAEVMSLQQLLQQLGYFPSTVPASGYFGPITKKAVQDFQRSNGVPNTGYVGPLTRGALSTQNIIPNNPLVVSNFSLDETSNGTTIHVIVGQTITLTLHSTYWSIDPSSDTSIVSQNGEPLVLAKAPGVDCVPGGGCGTIQATFTAKRPGLTTLSASRTICGEALSCALAQRTFSVKIDVK